MDKVGLFIYRARSRMFLVHLERQQTHFEILN